MLNNLEYRTQAPLWFTRDIGPGDSGPDVVAAKRRLGLDPETPWDAAAEQLLQGYFGTSVITADVAARIGESEAVAAGLAPLWFEREISELGTYGDDVDAVRRILRLGPGVFDWKTQQAVKRWQGSHGITPDGVVTEELALKLGE